MMRQAVLLTVALCILAFRGAASGQSARDYYNELYKAGGLDRMADLYACFDDDQTLKTFFIFAESTFLKDMMVQKGAFANLSPAQQKDLARGFLIMRGYDRGVPQAYEDFLDKDGEGSWIEKPFTRNKQRITMKLSVSPSTLRYKRTAEILDLGSNRRSEVFRYGRCEDVSPAISQNQ